MAWCCTASAIPARLAHSTAVFGFAFDQPAARRPCRPRPGGWAMATGGCGWPLATRPAVLGFTSGPLALRAEPVALLDLAATRLPVADLMRRHKSSARATFDTGWQAAEREGGFDALFFNTRDELLEGGRSSVFVKVGGRWLTPPLSADILPGVMRAVVLEAGDAAGSTARSSRPWSRRAEDGARAPPRPSSSPTRCAGPCGRGCAERLGFREGWRYLRYR